MSNILAIETSTAACSVALLVGEECLQRHVVAPREHAQLILPWIDALLAEAGIVLGQLDAVAVGRGPGGFTGVRIGVGVVQGLALGADLPVVPVSSLQVIAQTAYHQLGHEAILVGQDARMNEVYWAAYGVDAQGHMVSQLDEQLRLPSKVALPAVELSWVLVGDAWETYQAALAEQLQPLSFHPAGAVLPEAQCLASLAAALFAQGQVVAPEAALPVYLRGKEAWSLK